MKKQDILIIAALFGLWLLWGPIDRLLLAPLAPAKAKPAAEQAEPESRAMNPDAEPALNASGEPVKAVEGKAVEAVEAVEPTPDLPEETAVLANERMRITVSTLGASIKDALLESYPASIDSGPEDPVLLDFSEYRALAFSGLAGLSSRDSFDMKVIGDGQGVTFSRRLDSGLVFERTLTLGDRYTVDVMDRFTNAGSQNLAVPESDVQIGLMSNLPGETITYGMLPLGVDTLSPGEKVKRWGKNRQLPKWAEEAKNGVFSEHMNKPVDWVAVKNKYFVQTLRPEDGAANFSLTGRREQNGKNLESVAATVQLDSFVISAGTAVESRMTYYVGPKKLSDLRSLGYHQQRIMDLGWWFIPVISEALLTMLNAIQSIPFVNYGVAIMIVTLIIRIVFWPLTHKGTESMRRMQELSPQMKELNEKYKDDPQRKQQELMAFYKENKINPLGGCLPMLIQFPFFIGLFYVLRSAIELRFASFLWIDDLSAPDALFSFGRNLPFIGESFNLLPILMAVTMFWQQKITPTPSSAGSSEQAKMQQSMMKIMPVMMLVMLYKFPSGLALYWATQNMLMIVQHYVYKKRKERKDALAAA